MSKAGGFRQSTARIGEVAHPPVVRLPDPQIYFRPGRSAHRLGGGAPVSSICNQEIERGWVRADNAVADDAAMPGLHLPAKARYRRSGVNPLLSGD
jgi:hypothetical protein